MTREIIHQYGKIDILVNNAGLWRMWKPFVETTSDEWKKRLNVNVLGLMCFTHEVLPNMIENAYGRIINIGSVAGVYGNANMADYSMTKGAVNSFTKALAKEVSDKGITVNNVVPGSVRNEGAKKRKIKGDQNMDFTGKTAISTGAASGMGLLFAQNWADLGGNVLMCDVNEEGLNKCVEEINAKGKGKAIGVICDVRDYEQVCRARDEAVESFGSIDVMCNFAGGTAVRMLKVDGEKYPEFPDVPIDVYDWGIDVNLKGPFYFAHAVLKQMREQKSGLIINIGSITGQEGDGYGMDYPTSKAGLMFGLTKSIAQYGSKYGVRCVCVSPGPVLTRAAMANMKTLLGRAAEPQEIIDLILFIASDKGQFINGENIMIDGGRNAAGRRC